MSGLLRDARHYYSWNGGDKVPGITTVQKMLANDALVNWAKRETAIAAVRNWDIVHRMVEQNPPVEESLPMHPAVGYLKGVPGYQRDAAADLGTRVHSMAERAAAGVLEPLSEDIQPFADAYRRDFLERFKPKFIPQYLEYMVYGSVDIFGERLEYGGTMDVACKIGDDVWLIDYKTSRESRFGWPYANYVHQLAAGANAGWRGEPGNPKKLSLPKVTRFGILAITPAGAELIPFDVTDKEWHDFAAMRWLWEFVHRRAKTVKGEAA